MTIKQMMQEMFVLQNKLNIETNGKNWRKGYTREGREINWKRCIYMEAFEAIDSLNWKHWKSIDKEDDIENLKIELVDIWHFIISDVIASSSCVINVVGILGIANTLEYVYEKRKQDTALMNRPLIEFLENIASVAINKHTPTEEFFLTIDKIPDFDFNSVYKLYIGKNCLNKFRQDHGYKNGEYIKVWGDKEDNIHMQNILQNQKNITFDDLYKQLEKKYQESIKK